MMEYKIPEHIENVFSEYSVSENCRINDICDSLFQKMLISQHDRKSSHNRKMLEDDGFSGPTEEELRQIKAERKKKWEREAEYSRLLEESSLERRFKEKINVKKYPHGSFTIKGTVGSRTGQQNMKLLIESL